MPSRIGHGKGMEQHNDSGKHFAAGGDHFAALPSKKIHTPKGIARLTVTAATMAAMTGSSLISPFTAFAQTGDGARSTPP